MNPHSQAPISPQALISNLWQYRRLIMQMARREVAGRYKGSVMGLLWSFLTPLFMLAVYTFVFSVVFKARWTASPDEGKGDFAVLLFAGMIVHGLFAEVLNRAPGLILANVNYVKKVVFPLEILPVIALSSWLITVISAAALSVALRLAPDLRSIAAVDFSTPWATSFSA